jgi:CarD family transcriptional regulator
VPTKSASAKKTDLPSVADPNITAPVPPEAHTGETAVSQAPTANPVSETAEAALDAVAEAINHAEPEAAPEASAATEQAAAADEPAPVADDDDDDDDYEDSRPATPGVPRAANDVAPPLPRPSHSFGGGPRSPGGGRVMPPPRPMAKAELFVEGDHVVYPTHGVGKVERIATEEIAGHKLELIHITFEENRMTLRVPVAKARTAGLRKLATRKMFDEALAVLKGRARIKRTMWSRRAQEYEAKRRPALHRRSGARPAPQFGAARPELLRTANLRGGHGPAGGRACGFGPDRQGGGGCEAY